MSQAHRLVSDPFSSYKQSLSRPKIVFLETEYWVSCFTWSKQKTLRSALSFISDTKSFTNKQLFFYFLPQTMKAATFCRVPVRSLTNVDYSILMSPLTSSWRLCIGLRNFLVMLLCILPLALTTLWSYLVQMLMMSSSKNWFAQSVIPKSYASLYFREFVPMTFS